MLALSLKILYSSKSNQHKVLAEKLFNRNEINILKNFTYLIKPVDGLLCCSLVGINVKTLILYVLFGVVLIQFKYKLVTI